MINKSTIFLDFSDIIDRIKEVKSLKYDYEVADLIGLKRSAFSARKKSGNVPIDKIKIFCNSESIKFDWVVGQSETTDLHANGEIKGNDLSSDMKLVKLWSVRPGFLPGTPPNSLPEEPLLFIKSEIILKRRGPIKAFRIEGVDSSPHVKNGDIIIVACGERQVQGQHMYAIRTHFYLDVRHCHKENSLFILNPRRTGEPTETFDLLKSPDPLVGRVIGIINSHSE